MLLDSTLPPLSPPPDKWHACSNQILTTPCILSHKLYLESMRLRSITASTVQLYYNVMFEKLGCRELTHSSAYLKYYNVDWQ